MTGSGK
ncbi:hypothetical protein VULLAG_LOCUS398 [Vulpes lagopus]